MIELGQRLEILREEILMGNYILMIEKELNQAFKELEQPRSKHWNWHNSYSHISIMCPNSHSHFSFKIR